MTKEKLEKRREMTDKEILKTLGLSKKSCLSEQIVQTTHHWLDACDKIAELEKKIKQLQDDIDCLTLACENYREEMEKNLADATELEKENAELKTKKIPQLERKIASIRGAHSVDCRKLNARTEQVERLKKENAGLRKQVGAMSKALVLNVPEADEKLDRAKEIIASLLPFEHVIDPYALTSDFKENQKRFHEPFRKAEQFLKEE